MKRHRWSIVLTTDGSDQRCEYCGADRARVAYYRSNKVKMTKPKWEYWHTVEYAPGRFDKELRPNPPVCVEMP